MKKVLLISLLAMHALAIGTFTKIDNDVTLYSEYFPNHDAKFKGTIVFENGAGTELTEWKQNQTFFNCAKQLGSIFLYDRNSLGKSPLDSRLSDTNPETGKFMSEKLFKLLKQNKIAPPYIFVAHSYGGMYAGYFVLKNPDMVKAFLMVDPVPRNFTFGHQIVSKHEAGVKDATSHSSTYIYKKYGADTEAIYELLGFSLAKKEIADLGMINNKIPVVIISSTEMESEVKPIKEDWYSSQKQWLNDNTKSRIFSVKSGHFIQLDQPQIVCDEIKKLTNS